MTGTNVATTSGGGLLARYEQGDNPFLNDAGSDDFFGAFLKFNGNSGDFLFGDDYAEEIPHGSELLLNMETAMHGWICWVDGEVMDEQNVLIASGKSIAKESELEDFGPYTKHSDGTEDGWSEQYVFHLFWEKEDLAFTLKLSSKSGLRAAKNLVRAYGKSYGVKIGADGDVQVPVIEIGSVSFDVKDAEGKINKKAGKKHAPSFKIVDWADKSEVAELFETTPGDSEDDYDDEPDEVPEVEAPARGGRRAAPAKEEEAPARGGRRAAPAKEEEAPARGGRRRGAAVEEPAEEPAADEGDAGDDAPAEAPATGGRRARVVHAEPQDEGEDAPATGGRESARGRRGRAR